MFANRKRSGRAIQEVAQKDATLTLMVSRTIEIGRLARPHYHRSQDIGAFPQQSRGGQDLGLRDARRCGNDYKRVA